MPRRIMRRLSNHSKPKVHAHKTAKTTSKKASFRTTKHRHSSFSSSTCRLLAKSVRSSKKCQRTSINIAKIGYYYIRKISMYLPTGEPVRKISWKEYDEFVLFSKDDCASEVKEATRLTELSLKD